MAGRRIGIVGGGPAGLFLARLLRREYPGLSVRVAERNPKGATYGFGVTLGAAPLARLKEADPPLADALEKRMVFDAVQRVRLNNDDIDIEYAQGGGSIARLDLLDVLDRACREVGVEIAYDHQVAGAELFGDCDLVVAADGANSAQRDGRADRFGKVGHALGNRFAWFGVAKALSPNALVFREALGGRFIAHYYAYGPAVSTFVAECDAETWSASGFDAMSDAERKAAIETIFAPELEGAPLVENRSIWRRFEVVGNERWFDGRVVLIGDALRPAHFSIGSGTRLAMEDAHALFTAIRDTGLDDIPAALSLFVERRQPIRDLFAEATERSFDWYEDIARSMRKPVLDFAYDFLTRTGRVDDERLVRYAPAFARRWAEARRA